MGSKHYRRAENKAELNFAILQMVQAEAEDFEMNPLAMADMEEEWKNDSLLRSDEEYIEPDEVDYVYGYGEEDYDPFHDSDDHRYDFYDSMFEHHRPLLNADKLEMFEVGDKVTWAEGWKPFDKPDGPFTVAKVQAVPYSVWGDVGHKQWLVIEEMPESVAIPGTDRFFSAVYFTKV